MTTQQQTPTPDIAPVIDTASGTVPQDSAVSAPVVVTHGRRSAVALGLVAFLGASAAAAVVAVAVVRLTAPAEAPGNGGHAGLTTSEWTQFRAGERDVTTYVSTPSGWAELRAGERDVTSYVSTPLGWAVYRAGERGVSTHPLTPSGWSGYRAGEIGVTSHALTSSTTPASDYRAGER